MISTGIADTAYFGPEAEFFVSTTCRFEEDQRSPSTAVDYIEGHLELGQDEGPNRGSSPATKEGSLPRPADGTLPGPALGDDPHHGARRDRRRGPSHEVGTAGQAEIDMRFRHPAVDRPTSSCS